MSDELYKPTRDNSEDTGAGNDQLTAHTQRNCNYCGSELSPYYYFCRRCGSPYKPVESVLPDLPQPYEDDEMRIRYRAPQAINVFLIFLGVLLMASVIGSVAFGDDGASLQIFVSATLVITTVVMSTFHWQALKAQFAIAGFGRREFYLGIPVLGALLLINYFYHSIIWGEVLDSESGGGGYENVIPSYAGRVLLICIIPAIIEEIAFRGLIQHWLHVAISPWKAIVLASIVFSAAHFAVISAPYLFFVGVLLGWLRWKTGALYPSMVIHFLHNFVVISYF